MDPHPVIVTIRDNRDYIRVLLYSYYTNITRGRPPKLYMVILGDSFFKHMLMNQNPYRPKPISFDFGRAPESIPVDACSARNLPRSSAIRPFQKTSSKVGACRLHCSGRRLQSVTPDGGFTK